MSQKQKLYDENHLQKALSEIRTGNLSKKKAALLYGIPRSTLQFRLGSKLSKIRHGPATVLTETEELTIVEWLKVSQRKGFPKRKEDVLKSVQEFLLQNERNHPFGPQMIPGYGWFKAFMKRHPTLTLRATDPVSSASANVAVSDIHGWFDGIESYLTENSFFDILNDPYFNGDETNFQLCPKTKNVLSAKGAKNIYEIDRGLAKPNLTVMFSFSATGKLTPPMIIYPYKRMAEHIRRTIPNSWGFGISDNGWMTKQTFYEYIAKVFYPDLISNQIKLPVILFVDGHSTHLTLQVSQLCIQLKIILIALYPNSTRILQPADVAAFKPLKNGWNKSVLEWRRSNPYKQLTKEEFAPLLKDVVEKCISVEAIKNGFKACGLYPWNKFAIKSSKCLGRSTHREINLPTETNDFSQESMHTISSIIGVEIINQFKKIDNEGISNYQLSEERHILYKIYRNLKENNLSINIDKPTENKSCQTDSEKPSIPIHEAISPIININSIDEFYYIEDHENVPNISICPNPSVAVQPVAIEIDKILDWPETPLRKGIKANKQKKSFVITNSLWIAEETKKKEEQIKAKTEKENKKTERIEKKKNNRS